MRKKSDIKTTTVAVRVPTDIKDMLEIIACKEERTFSQQVIFYLKKGIREWEDQHPPKVPYVG
jgi:hypothetical protein